MLKRIDKLCLHCDNSYSGTKNSKYCGQVCSKEARKKRIILSCKECKQNFEVQEWNKSAKFCSYDCKNKNQSSNIIEVICNNCNIKFNRKEHLIGRGKHNFCSKNCHDNFNTGSNHYEWKEHLHDKNVKLALKQWATKIKERDDYTCKICGNDNKQVLEAHHIKHKSKFPELQFDYDNGITLCLNCHSEQHLNDIKALRLIKYKMMKIMNTCPTHLIEKTAEGLCPKCLIESNK